MSTDKYFGIIGVMKWALVSLDGVASFLPVTGDMASFILVLPNT